MDGIKKNLDVEKKEWGTIKCTGRGGFGDRKGASGSWREEWVV